MTTKTISAKEATVKTATVEVKALTVSGRQVTLSLFRQLKLDQVVDEQTILLRGPVWGTVNYFWGDDAKRSDDPLHVVWQLGDELRRAIVPSSLDGFMHWRETREALNAYFKGMILYGVIEGHITGDLRDIYYGALGNQRLSWNTKNGYSYETSDVRNALQTVLGYPAAKMKWEQYAAENDGWYGEQMMRDTNKNYVSAVATLKAGANAEYGMGSYAESCEHATATAKELDDAESCWRDLQASLRQLDQLFIAT